MPTENRSNDADGWIACDDGLHLIQMDKNLSHYGWVFRNVDGGLPYSIREATSHEMAHAQARQHLRIGVAQIAGQAPAPQPHPEPIAWMVGTAFWWTKEEAERDAAETGLQAVPVGPMVTQHGEPACFMTEGGVSALHAKAKAMSDEQGMDTSSYCVPLYTNADPAEIERLVAANTEYARRHLELNGEIERLKGWGKANQDLAQCCADEVEQSRTKQAETRKLLTWLCNDIDSGLTSNWHAKLQNHLDGLPQA